MNNRWARQIESKGSLKSSGQNNINININFNAVKDKANIFAGKKIDNLIQICNQPKPNLSRPNVSMQTLKQKKKRSNKQQIIIDQQLQRKKSKSKLINDMLTPEKKMKQRHIGNSRSLGRKSTKKRSAKSFDNLKRFYGGNSPRELQKYEQRQISNEQQRQGEILKSKSKSNSRSKSKSRSKSNKKLIKNNSKAKIPTSTTNTKARNSSHNSKKQQEDRHYTQNQKPKKQSIKKSDKFLENISQKVNKKSDEHNIVKVISKKPSNQKISRKKYSQDQNRKASKLKTPKTVSKQKDSKSLKRLPLQYPQQQSQNFDEQNSYKKMQKQAHLLLYDDSQNQNQVKKLKNQRKEKNFEQKSKQTCYERYLQKRHTYQDLKKLNESIIIIQKIWKGYKTRTKFINQLNLLSHKIQITKNKIATIDPKFWDDAQSNSILKAEDAYSSKSSSAISQLKSEIQKSVSQNSSTNKNMRKNRIVEYTDHESMLQKISKLQQNLKKQQQKAQKLEQQNKQLKVNLQKVSVNGQSGLFSGGGQSMQSSLKSDQSWQQVKIFYKNDPFFEQQKIKQKQEKKNHSQQFQLRLPKRINSQNVNNNQKQKQFRIKQTNQQHQNLELKQKPKEKQKKNQGQKQHERQKSQQSESSLSNSNNSFKKYKNKMQQFPCSSPKYSAKVTINSNLLQLIQKKQDQIKQNYQKKSSIFDRMLNDQIFSPRTYTLKKNQLQERFKKQTQQIRYKKQQVVRVAQYIKQIQDQQPKPKDANIKVKQEHKIANSPKQGQAIKQAKPSIIRQQNHIIEDYGNMNLNSYRSKSQNEQNELFQSSVESQTSIFKKKQQNMAELLSKQIQSRNKDAIRIFQEVSQENKSAKQISENNSSKLASNQEQQDGVNNEILNAEQQDHQQNQSRVMQQPNRLVKGFETTLLFIRQYCISLIQFIQNVPNFKEEFIQEICKPIVYDQLVTLKSYRTTSAQQNDSSYNTNQKEYMYPYLKIIYQRSQVISREAFSQFNKTYDKLSQNCQFSAERQFFLNSLLDGFNESLDFKRPCSIYGQPPAWVSQSRALKNYYLKKKQSQQRQRFCVTQKFDEICGGAIAKVVEWATSLCGFIPQSPQMQNVVIEQQQINNIRQQRVALMLQKNLLQNQESMTDSLIYQTQVKLQLGQLIFRQIIQQFSSDLQSIKFFN